MPRTVPIEIFNIGRTEVDRNEVRRWLDFLGADGCPIPSEETVTNPALLVALAAKRCYKSFEEGLNPNVTKIRRDYGEYLDNVLASGHGSVLEHSVYTFAIENVSRVFTGEMNRHRAGWAISEGSMRYIRFEDIPYWLPTSIQGPEPLEGVGAADNYVDDLIADPTTKLEDFAAEDGLDVTLDLRKQLTRAVFRRAFTEMEACYGLMLKLWDMDESHHDFHYKKKVTSMMRRIIGMGVASGGVWTGNIRALRHVITTRCSEAAEEEILHVFTRIAKRMAEKEPMMFGDFTETEEGFWVPKYVKV